MTYKVIGSSSKGNAVLYHDMILVDCGVPYSQLKDYSSKIKLILLTHGHSDHINLSTIKRLLKDHPTIRVGCCEWMVGQLNGIKVDVYKVGQIYDYGLFSISPIRLYHDVPNCGFRIIKGDYKIIHCTDTSTLDGISAKGYDLYAIEHNYNEDTIYDLIRKADLEGRFTHLRGSINSHLSEQQARDFIYRNKKESSEVLRLHQSTTSL